jgi:transcriptional regulator with XRE-family HTH domain
MADAGTFSSSALAELRRAKGMSQEELARRAGLATVTVAKLEEGRIADPKSSTVGKLAAALGCPVDRLLEPRGGR